MAGPARAGVLIYAKDLERLASFYETLLTMSRVHADEELVVLESPDIQLVIHAIPAHLDAHIVIASPPVVREEGAIKPFFTVPGIEAARDTAARLGGEVFTASWSGAGFTLCNGRDPEGNVFQVREFTA